MFIICLFLAELEKFWTNINFLRSTRSHLLHLVGKIWIYSLLQLHHVENNHQKLDIYTKSPDWTPLVYQLSMLKFKTNKSIERFITFAFIQITSDSIHIILINKYNFMDEWPNFFSFRINESKVIKFFQYKKQFLF